MDWQKRIVADTDTLFGKPRIAGTRIGVAFVLDRLASGWSEAQVFESYPHLTPDDLRAVFAFARDCVTTDGPCTLQLKTADGGADALDG